MTRNPKPRRETWRTRAAALIWQLKQGQPGITRRELRAFYPWGERKGYPYRAWCQEARALVGPGRRRRPAPGPAAGLPLEGNER